MPESFDSFAKDLFRLLRFAIRQTLPDFVHDGFTFGVSQTGFRFAFGLIVTLNFRPPIKSP